MSLNQGDKQAGISLSGALGGSFRGLKPMGIGASRLSNKPQEPTQLGDKPDNPFLKKKQLSQPLVGGNLNKTATQFDVTPYTLSSYDNLGGLRAQAYTDQNYTSQRAEVIKAASFKLLSALTSAAIPKVMEAFPAAADYSKNLVNSYKQYSASKPFAESGFGKLLSSFGENLAAEGKGRLASGLASGVSSFLTPTPEASPAVKPPPKTVSRHSMLGSSFTPKPQNPDESKSFNNLSETLGRVNAVSAPASVDNVNDQYKKFLAGGGQATTPQNMTPVGTASNPNAIRAVNSGLSPTDANRPDLAKAIYDHVIKNKTGDLTDLSPEVRNSFNNIHPEDKEIILQRTVYNAREAARLKGSIAYEPVYGSERADKAILGLGEMGNSLTNAVKTLGSLVPGIDPTVPIPNLPPPTSNLTPVDDKKVFQVEPAKKIIAVSKALKEMDGVIKGLDIELKNNPNPASQKYKDDYAKRESLLVASNEGSRGMSNIDLNAEETLPLFNQSNTPFQRGVEALFDTLALHPAGRAFLLRQGGATGALNLAGSNNAELLGGLLGFLSPNAIKSIPQLIKNIKGSPASLLSYLKNFNTVNAIKGAPGAALNVATSTPLLVGATQGPAMLQALTEKPFDGTKLESYFPPTVSEPAKAPVKSKLTPSRGGPPGATASLQKEIANQKRRNAPAVLPTAPPTVVETPKEAPASVVEAPAPVVEAPAPVVEAPAQKGEAPAQKGEAPAQKGEAPAQKGEAPPLTSGAPPPAKEIVKEIKEKMTPAGLSSLQKALIAGGMTIPAVLALTQVLKGSQESEEDDDEA